MITEVRIQGINDQRTDLELIQTIRPSQHDGMSILDFAYHQATIWLNAKFPGQWKYTGDIANRDYSGQFQFVNGRGGDLVPCVVSYTDPVEEAERARRSAEYWKRENERLAKAQIVLEGDPLYPAIQAAWALYAPTRNCDPNKPVRYEEHISRFECDGIALGRTLQETLDFLRAAVGVTSDQT